MKKQADGVRNKWGAKVCFTRQKHTIMLDRIIFGFCAEYTS
jgi:hypothetical protein